MKSGKAHVVMNFIKDKIESFSDAEVCTDDNVDYSKKIGLLNLDRMCLASSKILVVRQGALWDTKNSLKGISFFLV